MLQIILGGILVSLLTEVIKKMGGRDKSETLLLVLGLSVIASLIAYIYMGHNFFGALWYTVIYAGAFYAFVLRSVKGRKKKSVKKVIKVKKWKK